MPDQTTNTAGLIQIMPEHRMPKVKKKTAKKRKRKPEACKKPQGSGKFVKGNACNKTGKHPEFKQKLDFAIAFKAAVSNDDIKAIAKKLIKDAKAGNVKAAKEVLDRCCGKPPQALEIGGADGGPLTVQIMQFGRVDDSKPTIPG